MKTQTMALLLHRPCCAAFLFAVYLAVAVHAATITPGAVIPNAATPMYLGSNVAHFMPNTNCAHIDYCTSCY
jgi:hypothetical protein